MAIAVATQAAEIASATRVYRQTLGLKEAKRVVDDSKTDVIWASLTADNDSLYPRRAKEVLEQYEEYNRSVLKQMGVSAVQSAEEYKKAVADAEKKLKIDDAREYIKQYESLDKAKNDNSDDMIKVDNHDRERDANAKAKYRIGKAEDRVESLGGDPSLVQSPSGNSITNISINSFESSASSSRYLVEPTVGGGSNVTALSNKGRRVRDFQLLVAASDLTYVRKVEQSQLKYEENVSRVLESEAHYYSDDREIQTMANVAASTSYAQSLAYALAAIQSVRDLTIIGNNADADKARKVLNADASIARQDAEGDYKKGVAIAKSAQSNSVVTAESASFNVAITSNYVIQSGIVNAAGAIELRTGKETAADSFLNAEFGHAKEKRQAIAASTVSYVTSLGSVHHLLIQADNAARLLFVQGEKELLDQNDSQQKVLELLDFQAGRISDNVREDFSLSQRHAQLNQIGIYQRGSVHDAGEATVRRLVEVAYAASDLVISSGVTFEQSVHAAYDNVNALSLLGKYAVASADAQLSWLNEMNGPYIQYVTQVALSQVARVDSLMDERALQEERDWQAAQDYDMSVRQLSDAYNGSILQSSLNRHSAKQAADRQLQVEQARLRGEYLLAVADADDRLSVCEAFAEGKTTVAEVVKGREVQGAYRQLLDLSDGSGGIGITLDVGLSNPDEIAFVSQSPSGTGAAISPGKQQELDVVSGRLVRSEEIGEANAIWTSSFASARRINQQVSAIADRLERESLASAGRNLSRGVAQADHDRNISVTSSLLQYWFAEVESGNDASIRESVASSNYEEASLQAKEVALQVVADEMQLPWSDYCAGKALSEMTWWQTLGAEKVGSFVGSQNQLQSGYQTSVNSIYMSWKASVEDADLQSAFTMADSRYAVAIDNAFGEESLEFTRSDLERSLQSAHGALRRSSFIEHYLQQDVSAKASSQSLGLLTSESGYTLPEEAADASAIDSYLAAVVEANDERVLEGYKSELEGFKREVSAISVANTQKEVAWRNLTLGLSSLNRNRLINSQTNEMNYATDVSVSVAVNTEAFASNHPSPWAWHDAIVSHASAAYVSDVNEERLALTSVLAAAMTQYEVASVDASIGYQSSNRQAMSDSVLSQLDLQKECLEVSTGWFKENSVLLASSAETAVVRTVESGGGTLVGIEGDPPRKGPISDPQGPRQSLPQPGTLLPVAPPPIMTPEKPEIVFGPDIPTGKAASSIIPVLEQVKLDQARTAFMSRDGKIYLSIDSGGGNAFKTVNSGILSNPNVNAENLFGSLGRGSNPVWTCVESQVLSDNIQGLGRPLLVNWEGRIIEWDAKWLNRNGGYLPDSVDPSNYSTILDSNGVEYQLRDIPLCNAACKNRLATIEQARATARQAGLNPDDIRIRGFYAFRHWNWSLVYAASANAMFSGGMGIKAGIITGIVFDYLGEKIAVQAGMKQEDANHVGAFAGYVGGYLAGDAAMVASSNFLLPKSAQILFYSNGTLKTWMSRFRYTATGIATAVATYSYILQEEILPNIGHSVESTRSGIEGGWLSGPAVEQNLLEAEWLTSYWGPIVYGVRANWWQLTGWTSDVPVIGKDVFTFKLKGDPGFKNEYGKAIPQEEVDLRNKKEAMQMQFRAFSVGGWAG